MQIIVNATFLINTLRTQPEILQNMKLSTFKSVATEIENELGTDINDPNVQIIQIESDKIDLSNDKKERISQTDINVTLPYLIADYLKRKSKEEYLPISAIARKYIARGVTEELIIEYHIKGDSISRISENIDVPIAKVMDVLSRLNEEGDVEKTLQEIETS